MDEYLQLPDDNNDNQSNRKRVRIDAMNASYSLVHVYYYTISFFNRIYFPKFVYLLN